MSGPGAETKTDETAPLQLIYTGISVSGSARQHNGPHYDSEFRDVL
jgi:hypothetical protein